MTGASTNAAAQLRRLLLALPALDDDRAHKLSDVAQRVGTDTDTLERDLRTLVTRVATEPAGFTEGVTLLLGADTVQMQTPSGHFRRPMALSSFELHALELGLTALRQEALPEDHQVIDRARERLRKAISAGGRTAGSSQRLASLGVESEDVRATRKTLQECIRARRCALITYRSASSDSDGERRVQPLGVVWARGAWYLVAWCERSDGMRVFRLDRIVAARLGTVKFVPRSGFSLESVLREGRVLLGESDAVMRVRFSPRVARWIAERERVPLAPDGSVVVEYPLLDVEWGVRHALGYGPDAEVLAPPEVRDRIVEVLKSITEETPA